MAKRRFSKGVLKNLSLMELRAFAFACTNVAPKHYSLSKEELVDWLYENKDQIADADVDDVPDDELRDGVAGYLKQVVGYLNKRCEMPEWPPEGTPVDDDPAEEPVDEETEEEEEESLDDNFVSNSFVEEEEKEEEPAPVVKAAATPARRRGRKKKKAEKTSSGSIQGGSVDHLTKEEFTAFVGEITKLVNAMRLDISKLADEQCDQSNALLYGINWELDDDEAPFETLSEIPGPTDD